MEETYYDFNQEMLLVKILGGFAFFEQPLLHKLLNIALIIFVLSLYFYIAFYSVVTMIVMSNANELLSVIKGFYTGSCICLAICLTLTKFTTKNSLKKSIELLKERVFTYEHIQDEYDQIRKERLRTLRLSVSFLTIGFYSSAFSEAVLGPILRYLLNQKSQRGLINPYLPFPLVVPFNTQTFLGYFVAYLSHFVAMIFIYSSFASSVETFTSCVVQLIVEFKVLNHSIRNIERRALAKLPKRIPAANSTEHPHDSAEFQDALFCCLRENILHHHAILRLKALLNPYLITMNLVAVLYVSILVCCAILSLLEDPKTQGSLLGNILGFFPMCYSGQLVIDVTEELRTALYSMPWPSFDKKLKSTLKIMLYYTQSPVVLRPKYFNIIINLETFADMFSAGYKISNCVRTND